MARLAWFIAAFSILAIQTPPAAAQAQQLPEDFKHIPGNAVAFAHLDFAKLRKSPVGETFRKIKAERVHTWLSHLRNLDVNPDDIQTVMAIVAPPVADNPPPTAIVIRLSKPMNRDKIVTALKMFLVENIGQLEELPGNRYRLEPVTFDLSNPTAFRVYVGFEPRIGQDPLKGPLAPAIRAAMAGKVFTLGMAFENLPDHIREDKPSPLRDKYNPFQSVILMDTGLLTADLQDGKLQLDAQFQCSNRARVLEAEKALKAIQIQAGKALGYAIQGLSQNNDSAGLAMVGFYGELSKVVEAARMQADGNEAAIQLRIEADFDYARLVDFAFGPSAGVAVALANQHNLKQIDLALHSIQDIAGKSPSAAMVDKQGKPLLSWRVAILPYLGFEYNDLYEQFRLDEPWDSKHNLKVMQDNPMPQVYWAPGGTAKREDKTTHYQVFVGKGALFDWDKSIKYYQIPDGDANTLMVVSAKRPVPWTKPDDIEYDPAKDPRELLLFIKDSCNVVFADSTARSLKIDIDKATLHAYITRAGGEKVKLDN